MGFSVTYDEKKANESLIVPEGEYRAKCVLSEESVSKSSGKDMLVLSWQLANSNTKIKYYLVESDSEQGNIILQNTVRIIFESANQSPPKNINAGAFMNLICTVQVKHDEYNGQVYPKIAKFIKGKKDEFSSNSTTGRLATTNSVPEVDDIPF